METGAWAACVLVYIGIYLYMGIGIIPIGIVGTYIFARVIIAPLQDLMNRSRRVCPTYILYVFNHFKVKNKISLY